MLKASARCLRARTSSNSVRDTNTAVNMLDTRPITSVTAKPFTGPVPNRNRNVAEINAARCVSTSVMKTRSKLVVTADTAVLAARKSPRKGARCRRYGSLARAQFLADTLKNQHIRIDTDADRQNDAGDSGQCQSS